MKFGSIREAVAAWVDKLKMNEEFTSLVLFREIKRMGINSTPQTIIRRLYECREDQYGYDWYPVCINKVKSIYRKVSVKDMKKKKVA